MIITFRQNQNKQKRNLKSGFSFIELIVVVAIIGILIAVVVPNAFKWLGRAKITRTEANLRSIKTGIDTYNIDNSKFPNKLEDLVKKPADAKKWDGPYIENVTEVPLDGWDNPFIYKLTPKGPHKYELYSESPEGVKYSVWK